MGREGIRNRAQTVEGREQLGSISDRFAVICCGNKKSAAEPTEITEINGVISENGATVNSIVDNWSEAKRPGYTTILKTLQKMEQKGIVGHRPAGKKYVYFPKVSKERITGRRLNTIIDRVFSGSKISFAEYFVNSNSFSPDELEELKKLISAKEREEKGR